MYRSVEMTWRAVESGGEIGGDSTATVAALCGEKRASRLASTLILLGIGASSQLSPKSTAEQFRNIVWSMNSQAQLSGIQCGYLYFVTGDEGRSCFLGLKEAFEPPED